MATPANLIFPDVLHASSAVSDMPRSFEDVSPKASIIVHAIDAVNAYEYIDPYYDVRYTDSSRHILQKFIVDNWIIIHRSDWMDHISAHCHYALYNLFGFYWSMHFYHKDSTNLGNCLVTIGQSFHRILHLVAS